MTTWLVLGSSPSAPTYYQRALERANFVCTTNAGIWLVAEPDFFCMTEEITPQKFESEIALARFGGTKIVSWDNAVDWIMQANGPSMGREYFDVILPCHRGTGPLDHGMVWEKGRYFACCATGGYMLQFAVNSDADEVLMVGLEGYRSKKGEEVVDTFDGKLGPAKGYNSTQIHYGPVVQEVIERSPGVRFLFYGEPTYPLDAPNLTIICDEEARV